MYDNLDFQKIIEEIYHETHQLAKKGTLPDYIPALAKANPQDYGISVKTLDGRSFCVGDFKKRFSIQSISKVFLLTIVFAHLKDKLWQKVGFEPSGSSFNSLVRLEYENGIPRNPFINAGALVTTDCLLSMADNPVEEFINFVKKLSDSNDIYYNNDVVMSELATSFRNQALAYFIKSYGNIENDVEKILTAYCYQCGLMMNCEELAASFLYLASAGYNKVSNEKILTAGQAKRINALMQTCGFYDESGQFAFCVGLPGKSGVGGGIVAVVPGLMSICVYSPPLNDKGNSVVGLKALEMFTTRTGISIF